MLNLLLAASLLSAPSALQVGSLAGSTVTPGPDAFKARQATRAPLAGNALAAYPWFEYVDTFNAGATVELAVDPALHRGIPATPVDVYVVRHKSARQWREDPVLQDARGAATTHTFSGRGADQDVITLDTGTLSAPLGVEIGTPYDVVVDGNRNGLLDGADWIDGGGARPGFWVVFDLTRPGPYAVTETLYSGGSFLGQDTYYPTDIELLGELPLVVISHGNGHNYQWYDHLGFHLASHGYVVMSHQNNTGPGIETASTTTLRNTNYLLANLDTIAGGVLAGHVDSTRITWFGHSRGGEGVTRAYDRLFDGDDAFDTYGLEDVKLVSSIAPTVFFGRGRSNPHGVTYHLWTGGADSDVNGCANCSVCQTFRLHDRATRTRMSISLHGVGHGTFHDGGGNPFAQGPCRNGEGRVHRIMRGYALALVKFVIDGQGAGEEFLWRQWERFRPIGAPDHPCVVVDLMYRPSRDFSTFVLDDYRFNPAPDVSSSGGAVHYTVANLVEASLDDGNGSFTHDPGDAMNGTINASGPSDRAQGVAFEFDGVDAEYVLELPEDQRDVSAFTYLSLRAAQMTRHPFTTAVQEDLTFALRLTDGRGRSSTIGIGSYGGGIEEPYQRTGCGQGAGWGNEFETIRVRLTDFQHGGTFLDLSDLRSVGLHFGPGFGSAEGRLVLDDVQFESTYANDRRHP